MKIDEYKKISDNVQVPDVVWEGYQNAIKQIKMEKETDKNIVKISKWKNVNALAKIAVVFGAVVLLSGGTFLSVKAYISHLEKIRIRMRLNSLYSHNYKECIVLQFLCCIMKKILQMQYRKRFLNVGKKLDN